MHEVRKKEIQPDYGHLQELLQKMKQQFEVKVAQKLRDRGGL